MRIGLVATRTSWLYSETNYHRPLVGNSPVGANPTPPALHCNARVGDATSRWSGMFDWAVCRILNVHESHPITARLDRWNGLRHPKGE